MYGGSEERKGPIKIYLLKFPFHLKLDREKIKKNKKRLKVEFTTISLFCSTFSALEKTNTPYNVMPVKI